ncbi:MAG: MBL fold metallo-hydrolase [Anaerolineae bacterium]|jgi:glyoxylase-like metal-dependent hydrolase (beta-lactamase superfamily II)
MIQATSPGYLHCIPIPTPFPVGPVNAYLVEGNRGPAGLALTLVDTGPRYDPARRALTDALADRGYRVADLRRILITHAHADHCGLAAELARNSGADVWTHTANVSHLSEDGSMIHRMWRDVRQVIFYARLMRWSGAPLPMMIKLGRTRQGMGQYAEPLTPDQTLDDGDVIEIGGDDWQVLHTPGHTGGLICLYQPERQLLISSDHLLRDISSNPIVDPPAPSETEPVPRLVQYLAQLRRVADLDVALALPGHGPPITDHRALIRRRLAFHEARAERILETLDEGALTAHRIATRFFPHLDPINAFLAISEVIGHLQWLETEGEVIQTRRGGVAWWQRGAPPVAR